MKKMSWLAILLVIFLSFTGCASNSAVSVNPRPNQVDGGDLNLVFFGALSLPFELENKSIWIEKGPIVIAQSETNIAYRLIDKEELEFIGTIKTPYEFFKSAFNKPSDRIEQSFLEGLGDTSNKSYHKANNMEFYIYEMDNDLKIYVLSPSLDFVVEVSSKGNSSELTENIINKTHLR